MELPSISRATLYRYIVLTVVIFTGLAWLINRVVLHWDWQNVFVSPFPVWLQIPGGCALGYGGAVFITRWMFNVIWLESLKRITMNLYSALKPCTRDALIISIAAGWGEELFFRGILQPVITLPVAAALFGLAHVGFRFHDSGMRQYFVASTMLGMILGCIAWQAGLWAAMAAHAAWDFGVFSCLQRRQKTLSNRQ